MASWFLGRARHTTARLNWSALNAGVYTDDHYGTLRDDDRQVIALVAAFFDSAGLTPGSLRAVDVGHRARTCTRRSRRCRFAASVDLVEPSLTSVRWLDGQLKALPPQLGPVHRGVLRQPHVQALLRGERRPAGARREGRDPPARRLRAGAGPVGPRDHVLHRVLDVGQPRRIHQRGTRFRARAASGGAVSRRRS